MRAPIELAEGPEKGAAVTFVPRVGECFIESTGLPVEFGATLHLCSWCSNDLTGPLLKAGYGLSHGICALCAAEFNRAAERRNAKGLTT